MTGRARSGAAAEVAGWWAALVVVWMTTLTAIAIDELIAACSIALPAAWAARVGRIAVRGHWRLPDGVLAGGIGPALLLSSRGTAAHRLVGPQLAGGA
jgi:hypothetical protein